MNQLLFIKNIFSFICLFYQYLLHLGLNCNEISFIVRISSKWSQIVEEKLINLSNELRLFIQNKNTNDFHPFMFSPIMRKKELHKIISYKIQQYTVCAPSCISIKQNVKIGFNKSIREEESIFLPKLIKVHDFTLSSLLKILSCLNQYTEVNLFLSPVKLKEENKRQIREIISRPGLLSEEFPDEKRRNEYVDYCRDFLKDKPLFFGGVTYSSSHSGNNNILKNAINNAFTGSFDTYNFEDVQKGQVQLYGAKNGSEQPITDLRFLYTSDDFINSFRFPFPQMAGIDGIANNHPSYNQLPENLNNEGVLLGMKKQGKKEKKIYISQDALRKHCYFIGKTSAGKTTLLRTMIMDRIKQGKGLGVIDVHGDMTDLILKNIPDYRKNDLIYFNPADINNNKIRLNILEYDPQFPEQKTFIIQNLISVISQLYDWKTTAGPMWERYNKTFCLLVMKTIQGTLGDVVKAFEDKEFRDNLLNQCTDKNINNKIKNMMECSGEQSFENFVPYICSKYNRFTECEFLGPVISERKSNISFREIMDHQKILLIKLPKGRLGEDGARFIAMILINRILLAAYSRENIPYDQRVDWTLFLDEFQNFASDEIVSCFAEARKYFLQLVVANQSLTALKSDVANALLANVGSIFSFRVGPSDAEILAPYFNPEFTIQDMINLGNYNVITRMLINDTPSKPFLFQTIA